jgi:hypothetical protein
MTASTPVVVCVLGMHRSGTSFITRALSFLGVDLGPEAHAMAPRSDNPLGFSEHQLITEINDEILQTLGGDWHTPPRFASGWEADARLDHVKDRARQILAEDFGSCALWGWKDPRTCLTLPFWQQLVPSMRYVICLRSPLDVACSLETRDGFSLSKSASLWIDHVSAALSHTSGQPRMVVSYDDALERPRLELERMAAFIGNPSSAREGEAGFRSFADETLRHHHHQTAAVIRDVRLPFPAKALYLSMLRLLDAQRRNDNGHRNGYEAAVEGLGQEARLADIDTRERAAASERESEAARALEVELRAELAAAQALVQSIAGDREELLNLATRLEAELDEARQRLAYVATRGGAVRTAVRVLLPQRLYGQLRRAYDSLAPQE